MAAIKVGKPFRHHHKATNVANRSHGQLLRRHFQCEDTGMA
ncbi:MAG: hypothetical protein ABFS39_18115 [Pseudomonadota bacterium]